MHDTLVFAGSIFRELTALVTEPLRAHHLPRHAGALSASWLTRALQGAFPGVEVKTIAGRERHSGTTDRACIRPTYGERHGAPESLFIKSAPPSTMTRIFVNVLRLGEREVSFYRQLAPKLRIDVPRMYFAAIGGRAQRFVLVLEDLVARGARLHQVSERLELQDMRRAMKTFARLHAQFCGSPALDEDLSWLRAPDRVPKVIGACERSLPTLALPRALQQHGHLMPDDVRASVHRIVPAREALDRAWTRGAMSVIHGDAHAGNLYSVGDVIGCLDWQVVQIGQGMRDVSYFLTTSLPRELRLAHERELVAYYLDCVRIEGVTPPSFETAWEQYRLHAIYAWQAAMFTTAAASLQSSANTLEGFARTSIALADLKSLEAMAALPRT